MEMKRPPTADGRSPAADSRPPTADGRSPTSDSRSPIAVKPRPSPPPSPALSDPGSAALLASLEELSDSLTAGDDGFGDAGASFAPEPPRPAPKVTDASPKVPVSAKEDSAAPTPDTAGTPRDAHYREVYKRFVEVRLECGEPTDDLTYDKFIAKLAQSRDAVMSKYACSDVRFQVYVKNGKAALKATPVK
jgi:hypothetical protein